MVRPRLPGTPGRHRRGHPGTDPLAGRAGIRGEGIRVVLHPLLGHERSSPTAAPQVLRRWDRPRLRTPARARRAAAHARQTHCLGTPRAGLRTAGAADGQTGPVLLVRTGTRQIRRSARGGQGRGALHGFLPVVRRPADRQPRPALRPGCAGRLVHEHARPGGAPRPPGADGVLDRPPPPMGAATAHGRARPGGAAQPSRPCRAGHGEAAARLDAPLRESAARHVGTVVRTLDAAAADENPVPREELLLHYLHMDLNRWGFVPAEESLLGVLASAN